MNYDGKRFRPIHSSETSETSVETLFEYRQKGTIITCAYQGGHIVQGHLIGLVKEDGAIDMRYHQVNEKGKLMTGICFSTPEIRPNGKIRLHERWEWTSGNREQGTTLLEEL